MEQPLTLSAAGRARLREIAEAFPDEAAALHAGLSDLLVQVIAPFEGRIWRECEVEALLEGMVEPIVSAVVADASDPWQQDVALLMTRQAIENARAGIVQWLLWSKLN